MKGSCITLCKYLAPLYARIAWCKNIEQEHTRNQKWPISFKLHKIIGKKVRSLALLCKSLASFYTRFFHYFRQESTVKLDPIFVFPKESRKFIMQETCKMGKKGQIPCKLARFLQDTQDYLRETAYSYSKIISIIFLKDWSCWSLDLPDLFSHPFSLVAITEWQTLYIVLHTLFTHSTSKHN